MADQQPAAQQQPPAADSEDTKAQRVHLADICAKGAAHYAHKQYDDAAECYATAAELQAELNGEMDPANAEILFLYGRSLFRVGQGKSDVLGDRAEGKQRERGGAAAAGGSKGKEKKAGKEEGGVKAEGAAAGGEKKEGEVAGEKKPLFQFTGDENWDDSDSDEEVSKVVHLPP